MSEFSEVYYLKSINQEEAVQLLKKAELEGYVYPARDGWVAFVANTNPRFQFSEKLKVVNTGILIQFVNAEDHGWGYQICSGHEFVCGFHCGFKEEMDCADIFQLSRKIEEDGFEKLLKEEKGMYEVLRKYFDDDADKKELVNSYDFTRDMKLYFSDWCSYDYAESVHGEIGTYGEYQNLELIRVN